MKMAHMEYNDWILDSQKYHRRLLSRWAPVFYSIKGLCRYAVPTGLVHASGLDVTLTAIVNNIPRRIQYAARHVI